MGSQAESARAIDFSRAGDWQRDPKHALFVLARYKFVSKMLAGMRTVIEFGAGDGIASEIVRREVENLVCTDRDPRGDDVRKHDVLERFYGIGFSGAFALDVIEHIEPARTDTFLANIAMCLSRGGVCIIGSPSKESQEYASPLSKEGHINCMTARELRAAMAPYFRPVFSFGMNDEVLHTGFDGMRHYNFAVGVK